MQPPSLTFLNYKMNGEFLAQYTTNQLSSLEHQDFITGNIPRRSPVQNQSQRETLRMLTSGDHKSFPSCFPIGI